MLVAEYEKGGELSRKVSPVQNIVKTANDVCRGDRQGDLNGTVLANRREDGGE